MTKLNITEQALKKLKKVWNITYWLIVCVVVAIGIMTLLATTGVSNGARLYAVSSGSMEPTIPTGSLILSIPATEYKIGDIATFKTKNEIGNAYPKVTTTHRIENIEDIDGANYYYTKGDANEGVDVEPVVTEQLVGKLVFHLPLLGYLISFTRTTTGLILLIIVPTVLIIYDELQNIKKEIIKVYKKRNEAKHDA